MERVLGIGGVFFRARDPLALAAWYERHLGINPVPKSPSETPWEQSAGPTVFAAFPEETDYFSEDKAFMLNFRVGNLDAMLAQLRAAEIAISHEQEMDGIGRFARIHDPEGNQMQAMQLKTKAAELSKLV